MRVLISGGGTGGHVYPALAVAEQLMPRREVALQPAAHARLADAPAAPDQAGSPASNNIHWIGSTNGMERALVERAGIPYLGIDTGQLRGVNPLRTVLNAGKMVAGIRQSLRLLSDIQPDVCLATGGYVCVPVVTACRLRGIPVLIYLPDMMPGLAIKTLSRLAQRVAVSFPDAAAHFGGEVPHGKAVVTGYPVRRDLVALAGNRSLARTRLAEILALPKLATPAAGAESLPLLLVWGGSQGSRSINQATWSALETLLPHAQILHVVGERDWESSQASIADLRQRISQDLLDHYVAVDYLHEAMPYALAAADLTIARAGASALGEFTVVGLPAVLVPLPFAGSNQMANAEQLSRCGAAVTVTDKSLPAELGPTVITLLQNSRRRQKMASAATALAQPNAAARIADELRQMARQNDSLPAQQMHAL